MIIIERTGFFLDQGNLILQVAPVAVPERRVYAAAARFVTLLPPEGGIPGGSVQVAPSRSTHPFKVLYTDAMPTYTSPL
jgi:hypothetical protein